MAVATDRIATAGPTPSLEEVRELARDYNLIPVRETLIDDVQTPVSAFLKLRDGGTGFLLESADQGRVGRYSFIGFRPLKVLRWSLGDPGDPYRMAAEELGRFRAAPLPGLPPFAGGAVGVFAYDLVRTVEPLGEPNPDPLGIPDLAVMLTDALVCFDHLKHTVTVLANVHTDEDLEASYAKALETIAEVRWRLAGPVPRPPRPPASDRAVPPFQSNMSRERFEAIVARIIEYIYAGDAYQVVPSQRWSAPVPIEAFSIYRGLRAGTLAGAPRVRAMQIIDELEPVKRGGYGGAIGWASYNGDLDTCIHIRTVVVADGVAHVQAGGGTVADAKPDYEFRESEAKARAVLEAIELASRQPDWS